MYNKVIIRFSLINIKIMPPGQQFVNPDQSQAAPFAIQQPSVVQIGYAGFWIRFLAAILDSVIVAIPLAIVVEVVTFIIAGSWEEYIKPSTGFSTLLILMMFLQIVLIYTYFVVFTYKRQATIGKKLLGLRVVSVDGVPLSLWKVILRETIGKIVSMIILYIGYLMIAFTAKKQGLHDKMAGSVVLSNRAERKTWAFVLSIIFASVLPIIAIIGILASVVLASLNVTRMKGSDALVKSILSSMRAEAEIIYNANSNSYATVCTDPQIANSFTGAETEAKTKVLCNATATAYAAYLPLKNPTETNTGWCIDSTGVSGESVALGNATVCPNASSDLLGL